jgi:hypothetical protein
MDWARKLPDKRDLLILALLVLLPLLSFSALFFSDRTLYRHDLTSIHYPLVIFKARLLGSGQIAFWNPHVLFGFPQLADQDVLALHPLNLILLLPLKPHVALSSFVVAHYILAGILGYALARSLQIGRAGAFITGVTFALGGYLMAQLTNLPIMTGSVWLPLILMLFVKALETMRPAYAILCGGAIALQILAAHPQVVFYSLFMLGSYGAFRLIRLGRDKDIAVPEKRRTMILLLSLMAIAVLVGLFLAAIQIAATWELKGLSPRATGLSYYTMTTYSLPPYNLLTFVFANILGNPVFGYTGEQTFGELHAYVGVLSLMLSLWAWSRRKRDPHVAFFTILAGGALLLALGRYTPLYHILLHVPGFNFFRAPARWLFLVSFSLSLLAGYGFDALAGSRSGPESRRFAIFWRTLSWANLGISFVLLAGLIFAEQASRALTSVGGGLLSEEALGRGLLLVQGLTRLPLIQVSEDPSTTVSSLNPALLYVLLSNAGFLLIHLWNRRRIKAGTFQATMISLIVVDLLLTGGTTINPVRDASYFERQVESTTFLRQNSGLHRVFPPVYGDDVENLVDNIPIMYDLYSVRGHASELILERYKAFIEVLPQRAALLNLAGVKYVLLEEAPAFPGFVRVDAGTGPEIHENTTVLPRAFVVHRSELIPSPGAVLERLLSDDFDPSQTVILEEPSPDLDQRGLPSTSDLHGAEITSYAPHRVVIEADLEADGFLVLSDTYYPGWRAFVDGREEEIYQADYLFRAVFLGQGEHVVEFRYSPLFLRTGVAIYLAVGAVLLGLVGYNALLRRRQRR